MSLFWFAFIVVGAMVVLGSALMRMWDREEKERHRDMMALLQRIYDRLPK